MLRSPWLPRALLLLGLALGAAGPAAGQDRGLRAYPAPERVRVLPVFFVPKGQAQPAREAKRRLTRHVRWAQQRYRALLRGEDTFELASAAPRVVQARFPLEVYRGLEDDAAQITAELLARLRVDRFTCPYVFVIVLVNPCENHPAGGGRPLNGGFDRGGGVVVMSSYGLEHEVGFQSTLRHELGHAFGLVHVDAYGRSMRRSRSIMSYDVRHKTRGFRPSVTPGGLLPEDRRTLALNHLVFTSLTFLPSRDVPPSYALKPAVTLGPMEIPDEARYVEDPAQRALANTGYELLVDGVRARHEPSWSRSHAVLALRDALARGASRGHSLVARHEGRRVHADGLGYELFYDGLRVGHDASWTRAQGLANLRWNLKTKPRLQVTARLRGAPLLWAEPLGYELFFYGAKVGHEATWTRAQGLENLRWNIERGEGRVITARLDGLPLRAARKEPAGSRGAGR